MFYGYFVVAVLATEQLLLFHSNTPYDTKAKCQAKVEQVMQNFTGHLNLKPNEFVSKSLCSTVEPKKAEPKEPGVSI